LRLYAFSPAWGLPTWGPFGLKLEACLRMLDLPYERVVENDPRKGPKGKSPWIEDGDVRMGDTELILQYLCRKHGVELDRDLSPAQRARGHVLQRTLEEHFHQVLQYELAVDDRGWAEMRPLISRSLPGPLLEALRFLVRTGLRKQLVARGIARH